ncbi:MAG TPA: glycosyltransferase, partial [Gemmatimonadales bacterium]|nr:glycosyltransferase [Gemmatimonadales bacterium]
MTPTLTLVIPCYRESDRFEAGPFHRFLDSTPGARLLLVDDGSPDDTLARLREAARLNPDRIGVLALDRNVGKGEAVRRGLLHALNDSPDLVGFWDADLAAPLEAVGDFLRVFETRPAVQWVLGSRWRGLGREVRRSAGRHYAGRGFATLASAV